MNRTTTAVLALLLALGTVQVGAQRPVPVGNPSGLRVVTGPAVAAFQVPSDMRLVSQERVGAGGSITAERYRQFVGDAEVLGGQITIYRDSAAVRDAVIGAHYPGLVPANSLRLPAGAAQSIAMARRDAQSATWDVDLMIHPDTARYFYRVESRGVSARWFYWIDGETGEIVNEYDGLTTGWGLGVDQTTQKDLTGLTTRKRSSYQLVSPGNRLKTYDARNRTRLPGSIATDTNDIWDRIGRTSPGQGALVDAHFYANVTDRYYLDTHGFNWTDHYSQGIVSSAHLGSNYVNAYWDGTRMACGDGDGVNYIEFSGDLDVVAHELTHGVTEATSNLLYQNQPGALNESFSDIMATVIESHHGTGNWTIAEDVTPLDNGIRNMADPGEDGQPSHYDDLLVGSDDNGFVHYNSGIPNHWFYLLVEGGQNADPLRSSGTDVVGIGLGAAADIAYLGFTALTASANFCAAREVTVSVAGVYVANVENAWDEVGVTPEACVPDVTPPVISGVNAYAVPFFGPDVFLVEWYTDEFADSEIEFTTGNTFNDPALVDYHGMLFRGTIGVTYEYRVSSTDASGNKATSEWYFFTLQ